MKLKKFVLVISILSIILLIFLHFREDITSSQFFSKNIEAVTGIVFKSEPKLSDEELTAKGNDDISKITVTFYGNTATQMGLTWYTRTSKTYGNDVQVYDAESKKKVECKQSAESGKNTIHDKWTYHQVVLSELTPATKYMYRVGDEKKDSWSQIGSFSTSNPATEEFNFIALSDTQGTAKFARATMKEALTIEPNSPFLFHSGDFVDDGGDEQLWSEMIDTSKDVLMNLPIMPAVGNHDKDTDSFWQHFNLQSESKRKETGVYYSLDYGKVHFAVLNTNEVSSDGASYVDDDQLKWLEKDLAHAKENGSEWIIVNMHIGCYTVGNHAGDPKLAGDKGERLRLGAVFEKYGVNLVIQGHDHIPCVTKDIVQGKVTNGGVTYMDTGAAGPKAYELTDVMPKSYFDLFQFLDKSNRKNNIYQDFADVQVKKDKIHVVLYERNVKQKGQPLKIVYQFDVLK